MLTAEKKLDYCMVCQNRKMDFQTGTVCGLTNQKPTFEDKYTTFLIDKPEVERKIALKKEAAENDESGAFSLEKQAFQKGALGGLALMFIAIVWFVGGFLMGYLFYYPPILFLIGLFVFIKGLIQGNYRGKT